MKKFASLTYLDLNDFIIIIITIGLSLFGEIGQVIASLIIFRKLYLDENWAIQSMLLLLTIRYLNPQLFGFSKTSSTLISYAALMFIYFRFIVDSKKYYFRSFNFAFNKVFFSCVMLFLILAIASSQLLALSIFKICSFGVGFFTVYWCLKFQDREKIYKFINALYVTWALGSLIIFFGRFGELKFGEGIYGLGKQPQATGLIIMLFLIAFIRYLNVREYQIRIFSITSLLILSGFVTLYLTQCRTAIFAVILSFILSFIVNLVFGRTKLVQAKITFRKNSIASFLIVMVTTLALFLVFNNQSKDYINQLIFKRRSTLENYAAYNAVGHLLYSREILLEKQERNIDNNYLTGIGFGVPSDLTKEVWGLVYIPGTTIPMSYPSEKGIIIMGLLEETGIIGLSIFLLAIASVLYYAIRLGTGEFFIICSAILINLGEMVFFSVGGIGILIWVIILSPFVDYMVKNPHLFKSNVRINYKKQPVIVGLNS